MSCKRAASILPIPNRGCTAMNTLAQSPIWSHIHSLHIALSPIEFIQCLGESHATLHSLSHRVIGLDMPKVLPFSNQFMRELFQATRLIRTALRKV